LIATLLERGYQVMVETSGERDISVLDSRVIRIVDLKCPGSGESARNRWSNLEHLTPRDELKFVLADRRDYEWARDALHTHRLNERVNAVLMSPVFGRLEPADLAAWILADRLPVRMQLQMHKHIWSPTARAV
jgi:7-carboxy-7-deazaguanine synthase